MIPAIVLIMVFCGIFIICMFGVWTTALTGAAVSYEPPTPLEVQTGTVAPKAEEVKSKVKKKAVTRYLVNLGAAGGWVEVTRKEATKLERDNFEIKKEIVIED